MYNFFFTGHAHITDFNIATRLQPDGLACSMSGTLPYMAPEVIQCALDEISESVFYNKKGKKKHTLYDCI